MNGTDHKTEPAFAPKGRVLITGATGMIGGHLLMKLHDCGWRIRALYRSEKSREKSRLLLRLYEREDVWPHIEWVPGNMDEPEEWAHVLETTDAVVHAAAKVSFRAKDRHEMMETNFRGTERLVNILLDYPDTYLLHVSSIAALGGAGQAIDEKAIWVPGAMHSYYAVSKYLAEMEVWRGIQEGLRAGMVNPAVVVGPPADGCRWENGFGKLVRDLDSGKMRYTFPGVTAYVDINDVTEITAKMLDERVSGERFIVSAENMPFEEILAWTAEDLGKPKPRKTVSKRWLRWGLKAVNFWHRISGGGGAYDPAVADALFDKDTYNNSKVRERFGHTFRPVRESVRHTVALYKKARFSNKG